MSATRQLAAILFSDIVGYTALMERNSSKALELVHISKGIQKPLVKAHCGKWIKEMGDGAMARFESALDAVKCAIEIQKTACRELDAQLRIGIHLGDVTLENSDIYGDGVNVASRLESIADPGGIYISHSVHDAIKGEEIETIDLGPKKLKNVDVPVHVFAIQGDDLPIPHTRHLQGKLSHRYRVWIGFIIALVIVLGLYSYLQLLREKPNGITDKSVAVLPFDNLSNDQSQDYISFGMMEAILSHLNKIEDLRLTSRTTMMTYKGSDKPIPEIAKEVAVRYILEGSVMRIGKDFRITILLVDGQTDKQLWSEYYDGNLSDLFGIQSSIAQKVSESLEAAISPAVKANIESVPTSNIEAYDQYLQAIHLVETNDFRHWAEIKDLTDQVIEKDSLFGRAYAILGWYYNFQSLFDRSNLSIAEQMFNKSLELDPSQSMPHRFLSWMALWHNWDFLAAEREMKYAQLIEPSEANNYNPDIYLSWGRYEDALAASEMRISSEPNHCAWLATHGMVQFFLGRLEESAITLQRAINNEENGRGSDDTNYYGDTGWTFLYMGRFEEAINVLNKGLKLTNTYPRFIGTIGIAYHNIGEASLAREMLLKLETLTESKQVNSPCFYLAMMYAQLGNVDLAFHWLEEAYVRHEVEMYWLKVEPPFTPLHNDPRWQVMLDKVGFPE